ncbi:MAG: hypothetical protein KC897_11170 [Candidatus Omnitrophica bacterium]|nr:hypothetical protein [Candidatus Omnitrophota bacterium]
MPNVSLTQSSFAGGVFAPSVWGRRNLEKYPVSARQLVNFVVHPHGPISNRGGLEYVGETKDSSLTSRAIPFSFSVIQSYLLEFGDQYIRVLKDGSFVYYDPGNATDIRTAALKWTPSGSGTNEYYLEILAGGDPGFALPGFVYEDVGGANTVMVEGTLGSLAAGEWSYGDNDSLGFDTIYVRLTDNTDPDTKSVGYLEASYMVEIATPYLEADVPLIKYTQSADVLYLDHPSYAPRKLSRTDHDTWTLTQTVFGAALAAPGSFARSAGSGTGKTFAVTAVNEDGEESVVSNDANGGTGDTFGWASVTGAVRYNFYEKQNGVYGLIGSAVGLSYAVPSSITPDFDQAPPQSNNPFGSAGNYPGVPAFFEQRLLHARTNNGPDNIFGSVIGAFDNHNKSSPIQDDDAYRFVIPSLRVNEIKWMVTLDDLIIGTSDSEWRLKPGSNGDTVTPTSASLKPQSYYGSSDLQPVVVGKSVLFVERGSKLVRDLSYSLEVDGYRGNDVSILAHHLFEDYAIKEWSYQQKPDSIIWAVREDGALLGLTYQREHDVWGWHYHVTDGEFESVATIPTESGLDETYFVVKRTINGQTKRYIERFRDRLPTDDIQDAFFVDSGLTYDVPIAITAITNGNPVQVTAANHGFVNGDLVDLSDISGMTELNVNRYKVKSATTNTFEITDEDDNDIDGSTFGAYVSGGYARKVVTVITGLGHLEGEAVAVLANGSVVPGLTVSSASITLPNGASRVHIGKGYTSDLETLDAHLSTQEGTTEDRIRSVPSVLLFLRNTRSLQIGPSVDDLVDVAFREGEDYGDPTEMFTGEREVFLEPGDERSSRIFMRNAEPLPITLLAVTKRIEFGEN